MWISATTINPILYSDITGIIWNVTKGLSGQGWWSGKEGIVIENPEYSNPRWRRGDCLIWIKNYLDTNPDKSFWWVKNNVG